MCSEPAHRARPVRVFAAARRGAGLAALTVTLSAIVSQGVVSAADGVETAGNVLQVALPAAAATLVAGHRDGKGAFELAEALAVTWSVTYTLKYGIDAERPNGDGHSFPSGHTSTSFAAAEFVRRRYGWELGAPAYGLASFVAYSRVESNQHYLRDVAAGAGLGVLSSYLFARPYKGWQAGVQGDSRSLVVVWARSRR